MSERNNNTEPGPIEPQTNILNVLELAVKGLREHALYDIQMSYNSIYTIQYHRQGVEALFTGVFEAAATRSMGPYHYISDMDP